MYLAKNNFVSYKLVSANISHLPVTILSFGASSSRYSWISYQLGKLMCSGKALDAIYPSEKNTNRLEKVETIVKNLEMVVAQSTDKLSRVAENTTRVLSNIINEMNENTHQIIDVRNRTSRNIVDIEEMYNRTTALEQQSISNDYYFKYGAPNAYFEANQFIKFTNMKAGNTESAFDGQTFTV